MHKEEGGFPTEKKKVFEASLVVSVQVLRLNVGKRKTCHSLFRTKNVCAKGVLLGQGPFLPSVYHGRHWHHSCDKCRPGHVSPCLHFVSNQKLWWWIAMMTWILEPVFNEVVPFSWKYTHHSTCSYVIEEATKKQHCATGRSNKWRQTPFAVIA